MATGNDMTTGKDGAKKIGLNVATQTATILSFPDRYELAISSPSRTKVDGASAEIIIFPGVRIERWDTAENEPCIPSQNIASGVSRDRLELLD